MGLGYGPVLRTWLWAWLAGLACGSGYGFEYGPGCGLVFGQGCGLGYGLGYWPGLRACATSLGYEPGCGPGLRAWLLPLAGAWLWPWLRPRL